MERATVALDIVSGSSMGFTTAMAGFPELASVAERAGDRISGSMGAAQGAILAIAAASGVAIVKASEMFGEYERGMKIVQAVSGQTAGEIAVMGDAAKEMSVQYKMDINEITEGLATLGRAGLNSTASQISVLEEGFKLAKLEGMDLNDALEKLVQTTSLLGGDVDATSFGSQVSELNDLMIATSMSSPLEVTDVVQTLKYSGGIADVGGINLENKENLSDLMGTISAFGMKGVSGDMAGTALRAFFAKPASQDKQVTEGLERIGMTPSDLWEDGGNKMRPVSEQLAMIERSMQGLSEFEKIDIWGKIVGPKMGQQMLKLSASDIRKQTRKIEEEASSSDSVTMTMDNFASNVETLKQQASNMFMEVGEDATKFLNPMVQGVTKLLELLDNPITSSAIFIGLFVAIGQGVKQVIGFAKQLGSDFNMVKNAITGATSATDAHAISMKKVTDEANRAAMATQKVTLSEAAKNKIRQDMGPRPMIPDRTVRYSNKDDLAAKANNRIFDNETAKRKIAQTAQQEYDAELTRRIKQQEIAQAKLNAEKKETINVVKQQLNSEKQTTVELEKQKALNKQMGGFYGTGKYTGASDIPLLANQPQPVTGKMAQLKHGFLSGFSGGSDRSTLGTILQGGMLGEILGPMYDQYAGIDSGTGTKKSTEQLQKEGGKTTSKMKAVGTGMAGLAGMFGPLEIAMGGVQIAMEIGQKMWEDFNNTLQERKNAMAEAEDKLLNTEDTIKSEYAEKNPNATEDQLEDATWESKEKIGSYLQGEISISALSKNERALLDNTMELRRTTQAYSSSLKDNNFGIGGWWTDASAGVESWGGDYNNATRFSSKESVSSLPFINSLLGQAGVGSYNLVDAKEHQKKLQGTLDMSIMGAYSSAGLGESGTLALGLGKQDMQSLIGTEAYSLMSDGAKGFFSTLKQQLSSNDLEDIAAGMDVIGEDLVDIVDKIRETQFSEDLSFEESYDKYQGQLDYLQEISGLNDKQFEAAQQTAAIQRLQRIGEQQLPLLQGQLTSAIMGYSQGTIANQLASGSLAMQGSIFNATQMISTQIGAQLLQDAYSSADERMQQYWSANVKDGTPYSQAAFKDRFFNEYNKIFTQTGKGLFSLGSKDLDANGMPKSAINEVNLNKQIASASNPYDLMYSVWGPTFQKKVYGLVQDAEQQDALLNSTGSGSDSSSGSSSGDSDSDSSSGGSGKIWTNLAICKKKYIPNLNVNLFKKAPSFTIQNRNFKVGDIRINTVDKPKQVKNALKNSIIEIQNETNPKIIQDESAEFDPVAASEGSSVPSGTTAAR